MLVWTRANTLVAFGAFLLSIGVAFVGGRASTEAQTATVTDTATVTETTTTTVGSPGPTGTDESEPVTTGLATLDRAGRIQPSLSIFGEIGSVEIAGRSRANSLTAEVYPDSDDQQEIEVLTNREFDGMSGVVSIADHAACAKHGAEVAVRDLSGHDLWGPVNVYLDSPPRHFAIDISGQPRVILYQRSLATGEYPCGNGQTDPAWGEVEFTASTQK